MIGVEFADVCAGRPPGIVDSAPSHFDLIVASPSLKCSVPPDAPAVAYIVALLEAAVYDNVLVAAESVPVEFDVVDELTEAVRDAGGDKVDTVLALPGLEAPGFSVDFVVGGKPFFESVAVPHHLKHVAGLADSLPGSVLEGELEDFVERIIIIFAVMGCRG